MAETKRVLSRRATAKEDGWTSSMDDESLVLLAQQDDMDAQESLIRRHWGFVKHRARNYFIPGADREDLIQEGLLGLIKAIRDFRANAGATFRGFAELCVTRQIITAVKTATRMKHLILSHSCSLDAPLGNEGEGRSLLELLPAHAPMEETLNVQEAQWQSIAQAKEILSPYEYEVMRLYAAGFSYGEIATLQGKSVKSVDSAVFKVKLKLRRLRRDCEPREHSLSKPMASLNPSVLC